MDNVFTGRMAGRILNVDQKKALESWVDTIAAQPAAAAAAARIDVYDSRIFEVALARL